MYGIKLPFVALSAILALTACEDKHHFVDGNEENFGDGGNSGSNSGTSSNNGSNPGSSSSIPGVIVDEPLVEDTTEVSDVKALPKCEAKNEGESFFVAKENTLYFCVGGEWRSDIIESVGVSCKDGSLILGSAEEALDEGPGVFGYDSIAEAMVYRREGVVVAGVAEKGPFLHGTSVTVTELDSLKRLADSERVHKTCITSSDGSYTFDAFDLVSPYVRVEADGFFKNELTGGLSSEQVKLVAVTDLTERDSVNVNILTHLEAPRTLKIIENTGNNQPIRYAKEQALKDVLYAFGIKIDGFNDASFMQQQQGGFGGFGGGQSVAQTKHKIADDISLFGDDEFSAALIAVSVMMQRFGSGKEMLNFATSIQEVGGLRGNGGWSDWDSRAKLADWLMVLDTSNAYQTIRKNLEALKQGDVPDFEKYLRGFWTSELKFPACNAQNDGMVTHVSHSQSSFFACNYTCEGSPTVRFTCDASLGRWRTATDIEKDTVGLGADTSKYDGALRPGVINKNKTYIYQASTKTWRLATSDDVMDFTDVADVYKSLDADESVVFILRHAERTSETGSKGHLTDNGKAQAKKVGEKFKGEYMYFGYSGYTRTLETCEGIAAGAGLTGAVTPEVIAGVDGSWYRKDDKDPSVEDVTSWAYRGYPSDGFYDLEERTKELVSTYILGNRAKLRRVNFYISHDKMVIPLAVYASQKKVDLRFFDTQGTRNWLNFLAGVAVIYNSAGRVRYVPVRGLESGTMKL